MTSESTAKPEETPVSAKEKAAQRWGLAVTQPKRRKVTVPKISEDERRRRWNQAMERLAR